MRTGREATELKMIEMTITRPDDKGFTAYFKTKKDLENFSDSIETIVCNAEKVGREEGSS